MGSGTKIHKIYRGASETPDPMEEQEVDGMMRYLHTARKWASRVGGNGSGQK